MLEKVPKTAVLVAAFGLGASACGSQSVKKAEQPHKPQPVHRIIKSNEMITYTPAYTKIVSRVGKYGLGGSIVEYCDQPDYPTTLITTSSRDGHTTVTNNARVCADGRITFGE